MKRTALCLLMILALALAGGSALAQSGPAAKLLEIDYDHPGALFEAVDQAMSAGPSPGYTGFRIDITEDFAPAWSELASLEMAAMDEEGSCAYAIEFVGFPDTEIPAGAFTGNLHVTRIAGLNGVTRIGDSAFSDCGQLIDAGLASVDSVGEYAFYNCASLESVPLASGATVAGGAFSGCVALTSVGPRPVVLLDESAAFENCKELKSINLADASALPATSFKGCTGLESVALGENAAPPAALFADCANISSIAMGGSARIGEGAFRNRRALKSLTLGNGARVGIGAFEGCTGLTSAVLGAKSELAARAFSGCTKLATVAGALTSVGEGAFAGCNVLGTVELDAAGAPVGAGAFESCAMLSAVSGKVSSVGSRAFSGCSRLQKIALVDGAQLDSYAFLDCLSLESVEGRLGPVGRSGFDGCVRLRSLNWPTVGTYGVDAFRGCALDFTKSVPNGLNLSNATRQVPYAVFALRAATLEIHRNATFDPASAYTLKTASGTPYSELRIPPYHWLDVAFTGDQDHSPKVALSGSYDATAPGSYPLKLTLASSSYANEHELSFTLRVLQDEASGEPEPPVEQQESSWFLPNEFVATVGFRYGIIAGDASKLTLISGKKAVAKIGADGTLAPRAAGTATITAQDAGGVRRKCKVKVVANRYARAKPHKGEAGELTTSTKRLYYQNGRLYVELFIVNRTGRAVRNVGGAKLQLWNERTGQLLYERSVSTLLKTKLPNKASRVFTANIRQPLINGGAKLDLGRGEIQAKLVF